MRYYLLITNTDLNTSAGNITLVFRRAEGFYREKDIKTEIAVVGNRTHSQIPAESECCFVCYYATWKELKKHLLDSVPEAIILYGRKTCLKTPAIKSFLRNNSLAVPVLADVQSCIEESWEYASSFKRRAIAIVKYIQFVYYINLVDGAFVVTDPLIDNIEKKRIKKGVLKYYKIRCGVNEVLSPETIKACRENVRKQYGISNDTVVFVFSGYRMAWQKIDEIIGRFRQYDAILEKAFFMFLCNTDDAFENQLKASFPSGNYLAKLLKWDDYYKTLCACDVGYLYRDYNNTNTVAFPNKFSDYLVCGLLVGINNALPEPVSILNNHHLPFLDVDKPVADTLDTLFDYLQHRNEYLRNSRVVCEEELLYSAQVKKINWE